MRSLLDAPVAAAASDLADCAQGCAAGCEGCRGLLGEPDRAATCAMTCSREGAGDRGDFCRGVRDRGVCDRGVMALAAGVAGRGLGDGGCGNLGGSAAANGVPGVCVEADACAGASGAPATVPATQNDAAAIAAGDEGGPSVGTGKLLVLTLPKESACPLLGPVVAGEELLACGSMCDDLSLISRPVSRLGNAHIVQPGKATGACTGTPQRGAAYGESLKEPQSTKARATSKQVLVTF